MSYLVLVIFWASFYFLHSVFADMKIKRKFKGWLGPKFIWYRLLYSLFASVHFLGILVFTATLQENRLFGILPVTSYFGYVLATFGTIILVKSFQKLSPFEFIGFSPADEFTKDDQLVFSGLHAYIRHPIYAGLLLIFLGYTLVQPVLSSMVHLGMLVAYLPIGIYLEEKKLIARFGRAYIDYRKRVPSLIPRKK
jgi:protein-S-isoprenylcysteine O-methyltransferase Ste14